MDGKALRDKLVGSKDERAVSPVIGVILMVAITVILAAVIATLVMDIGGDQQEPVTATVAVSGDGTDSPTVSVENGGNADQIVLVDSSGSIIDTKAATTGAVVEWSDWSQSLSTGSDHDLQIYAIKGDVSGASSVDSAEGSTQVAEFTASL